MLKGIPLIIIVLSSSNFAFASSAYSINEYSCAKVDNKISNINSQKIEDRGVILPSAFNLTKQDLMFVCENIKKIILK